MTETLTNDTSTSAGCEAVLARLRRQLHEQELRARAIDEERDRLALAAALARPDALAALRELAEESALLAESRKNLSAAIKEASRLQSEALAREAQAAREERYDRAERLRDEVLAAAEEIDAALRGLAEIVARHDDAARELSGLQIIDEGAMTYLAGAHGIAGATLHAGLGPAYPMIKPIATEARPLAASHRAMVRLPSRERYLGSAS